MVETFTPKSLDEALQFINQQESVVMAGGTDLMVKYRKWQGLPPAFGKPVVFIGHLPELQSIEINNNQLTIGAGCRLSQILQDHNVPDYIKLPFYQMASPGIRNLATIGGNICNSSPAGDSLPMLYALNATLKLQSTDRTVSTGIEDFIIGPGRNKLLANQILTGIQIPLEDYTRHYYRKIGTRKANSISKVSIYAVARMDANFIQKVQIALGAVAPCVVRNIEAEQMLKGLKRSELAEKSAVICDSYARVVKPVDDVRSTRAYRTTVSLNLVRDFIEKGLAR